MPKLTINGQEISVDPGSTVLQACEELGIEIPRFCYHDRLEIAGNCRMCLVEMERSPKPIASCAMPVGEGMVIKTNTEYVKKARNGVMEFLLINHPLDCPICDQGGECDLQDQAMAYGLDHSRYQENKRAVEDKNLGPLISTHMTRCIHCTRCVRFLSDVAGVEELGATGRGEHMEIGTYIESAVTSELSGNIIDLCPVGALNSKPYAYSARSWELDHTETVDIHDAVGSNIRVDSRGREVMRILPRLHEDINEEWISDKSRFSYDGLKLNRLDRPYIRENGNLRPASWDEALALAAEKLSSDPNKIAAIAGDIQCTESMFALKQLFNSIGSPHTDCRQDGAAIDYSNRGAYLFNTTIAGIEKSDLCLLIGANPRYEAPLLNARLRKRFLNGGFRVLNLGAQTDLTFQTEQLGDNPNIINEINAGTHFAADLLTNAKHPMLIIGQSALCRSDGSSILAASRKLAESFGFIFDDWNGFNILHTAAARVGGLDVGFVPDSLGLDVQGILNGAKNSTIEVVYLLGADEIDMKCLQSSFVIYQGHHGDAGANHADIILPGSAYTEKNATWVNIEGRPQLGKRSVFPPGDAREDWSIIRALSDKLGQSLPYNSLSDLRKLMSKQIPHLSKIDFVSPSKWSTFGTVGDITNSPIKNYESNFYLTNSICRSSKTMANCTKDFSKLAPMKDFSA